MVRARVAEWQTRRSQKPLSKDVRVRLSPRAPLFFSPQIKRIQFQGASDVRRMPKSVLPKLRELRKPTDPCGFCIGIARKWSRSLAVARIQWARVPFERRRPAKPQVARRRAGETTVAPCHIALPQPLSSDSDAIFVRPIPLALLRPLTPASRLRSGPRPRPSGSRFAPLAFCCFSATFLRFSASGLACRRVCHPVVKTPGNLVGVGLTSSSFVLQS